MNSDLFAELVASVREGGAILRGEAAPSRTIAFDAVDIRGLRDGFSMSQTQFAVLLGISVRTLRNWEQGRRRPEGPALVLLQIAAQRPEAVWDAVRRQPAQSGFAALHESTPMYSADTLPDQDRGHPQQPQPQMVKATDFARSFVTFRLDTLKKQPITVSHKPPHSLNNARIQLDCLCHVTDRRSGQTQRFVLGANCKTERVCVERDLWTEPNADYVPVFSDDQFLILKAWAQAGMTVMLYPPSLGKQPERQVGRIADTYDSVIISVMSREAVALPTANDIVQAALANQPLVAQTALENEFYRAVIEYPIKTVNANERDWVYQTDTGPILLPDLTRAPDDLIAGVELAFVAFNAPDWAEVIVRTPTPIAGGANVHHYSKTQRLDVRNTVSGLAG